MADAALATASAAAARMPNGRGSDSGRSEKRWDEGRGNGLRRRRQHQRGHDRALQTHLSDGRSQRLEATGEASPHVGANVCGTLRAGLRGLVTRHCRGGLRRPGHPSHGECDRRRHRHSRQRPQHGDDAESYEPALKRPLSHGVKVRTLPLREQQWLNRGGY